jgi:hypothetical protein
MCCPETIMSNATPQPTLHTLPLPEFSLILPEESTQQRLVKPSMVVKARRRVAFQEFCNVSFITPGSSMSQEERNDVWYHPTDLDDFKCQVRTLCRKLRDAPESKESSRGLEHRVCLERQRNKHLAIRCILKAQRRSPCPEFVAMISRKCTAWAKEVALAEASRDFCEAYYPHLAAHVPKVGRSLSFPVPLKKRGLEPNVSSERNIRQRTDTVIS